MTEQLDAGTVTCDSLAGIGEPIPCRMAGRVSNFRVFLREPGLLMEGYAQSYHARHMAQQAVMEAISLPIRASEIEAFSSWTRWDWIAGNTHP